MKLPNFKRIYKSDYKKDFQDMIETLSVSINYGIEVLYDVLNKKVSLIDNIQCTVRDVIVQVDKNGNPTEPTSFSLDVNAKVLGVSVIFAQNLTNSTSYPFNHPFISFTQQPTTVLINNISGLSNGTVTSDKYTLKIIAWA